MEDEFSAILEFLEIEDDRLASMRQQVVTTCQNSGGPQRILRLFMSKSSPLCFCGDSSERVIYCSIDNTPYCSLYQAYTYFCLPNYHEAKNSAVNTIKYFELNAHPVNQALALACLVLVLIKIHNHKLAKLKLTEAKDILNKESQQCNRVGKYLEANHLDMLGLRITRILNYIA